MMATFHCLHCLLNCVSILILLLSFFGKQGLFPICNHVFFAQIKGSRHPAPDLGLDELSLGFGNPCLHLFRCHRAQQWKRFFGRWLTTPQPENTVTLATLVLLLINSVVTCCSYFLFMPASLQFQPFQFQRYILYKIFSIFMWNIYALWFYW